MNPKSKAVTQQKNQDLALPQIIKSEVNLLRYPFFALARRGLKSRTKTEYREVIKRGNEWLEISWQVLPHQEFGHPGPFDREVHKTIESIISEKLERDGHIENPIALGSLYDLCRRIGLSKTGGKQYQEVKDALERIKATSIKSSGAFYHKEKKQWVEDIFSLYERVIFKGKYLSDGEMADTNYLFLGSWYLENLNAFYVRPLDYQYLMSLESPIASRLYELLGMKFYGAEKQGWLAVWFEYEVLCQLLPVTLQSYLSKAQEKLGPAHDELIRTSFLSKVEWKRSEDGKNWTIYYYPGDRAKQELKRRPIQEQLQLESPQEAPSSTSEDTPDKEHLLLALVKRGVGKQQARRLVRDHSRWVKYGIELWELERKKNPGGMKNPTGYLVSIIKGGEDWQPPEDYISSEELKRRAEKQRRDELVEELVSLTDGNTSPSPLLTKSEKDPTIKELELEVSRIKDEKAKRERDEKARVEHVLEGLNDQEREEIREEALARVDSFLYSSKTFKELSQQDIRDWQGSGPVVSPLIYKRDEIIREQYLEKGEQ